MRAFNWTLLAALATSSALHAEPENDYEAMRDKLVVLDDGKHHYLAYVRAEDLMRSSWFYGDDRAFRPLRVNGARPDMKHPRATWTFADPRYHSTTSELVTDFDTGEYVVACGKRKTAFHPLAAPAATKLVAKVVFEEPPKGRSTVYFAREDEGTTYYLLDRPWTAVNEPDSRDYRLFIGKRGAMRRLAIKEQAIDSAGIMIVTAAGRLRFTRKANALEWLPIKAPPRALTPLETDHDLLYNQLGVYVGERFGTPCDDM